MNGIIVILILGSPFTMIGVFNTLRFFYNRCYTRENSSIPMMVQGAEEKYNDFMTL
jgi:hypothetical protein